MSSQTAPLMEGQKMQTLKNLTVRSVTVLGLLLLTPLTFNPAGGVDENAACGRTWDSGGSCKRELDAACSDGTTANPWFWLVTSTRPVARSSTGWFAPRWPNGSLNVW